MVTVRLVMANPASPSPPGERARQHALAAARRYGDRVEVVVLALDDPSVRELGVGLEPTVLVGDLVVAVGMAPPAGHLVRAIDVALAKETDP